MRLGLCCTFKQESIHFRTTTARSMLRLAPAERRQRLRQLARHNAAALEEAILFCARSGIGAFRVNSQILPLKTHPRLGYDADLLGAGGLAAFRACGRLARERGVRLSFHPDQFVVLSSPRSEVVTASVAELQYQAEVADWIGADVINIHGGGAYGDKRAALDRLARVVDRLPDGVRSRLTLENDDRIYTPADLLPLCRRLALPLVYDAHHHRCHGDHLDLRQATEGALATWDREPLFHISSPLGGWRATDPRRHSELIDLRDFPVLWEELPLTVEVEAKAKELAVLRLARGLRRRQRRRQRQPVGG